jgi:hypothetical protein
VASHVQGFRQIVLSRKEAPMPFTLRQLDTTRSFIRQVSCDALATVIPPDAIDQALAATGTREHRCRRLSLHAIVMLVVAMNLWTHAAIPTVFRHLVRGLRWLWPTDVAVPRSSAFVYRRYQLGARPLAWLFRTRCRPLATARTPDAFLFGLHLMAIDGTTENLPDTPANARTFGYPHNGHGDGPFPQAQIVYLVECGTHAIVDAGIWPIRTHERVGGHRLLRSVGPGMLVMADRGFHSYRMVAATLARGAHLLVRLSTLSNPPVLEPLADGSQLGLNARPPETWQRTFVLFDVCLSRWRTNVSLAPIQNSSSKIPVR